MNIDEAVIEACKQPTLVDALSYIAVWECERAIKQARGFFQTGESTASDGKSWDTCFKVCFEKVMRAYSKFDFEKYWEKHGIHTDPKIMGLAFKECAMLAIEAALKEAK